MPSADSDLGSAGLTSALAASSDPEVRVILGMSAAFRAARIVAVAYPVKGVAGDNLTLHQALASAPPGTVIVAELDGSASAGHWGELMSQAAKVRGLAGLVIAGPIRDVLDIERLAFPVFHRGTDPRPATKLAPGVMDVPVHLLGTLVEPGDLVCADVDGIAIVPAARAAAVAEAARRVVEKERNMSERIQAGETTLAVLGLPSPAA